MRKWIWTFGGDTMFYKKYVVVYCEKGDGKEVLYEIYGKNTLFNSYFDVYYPEKEEELRAKGYKHIADWQITYNSISVDLFNNTDKSITITQQGSDITSDFKHKVWEEMIGGK